MEYCPLISYQKQYQHGTECMGEGCVLWSAHKNSCLIRLALLKYTYDMFSGDEVNPMEKRVNELEKQMQFASLGFPTYNLNLGGRGRIEKD